MASFRPPGASTGSFSSAPRGSFFGGGGGGGGSDTSFFGPGGALDIKSLGGVQGTLDVIGGTLGAIDSLSQGLIRASGERAKARAFRAQAVQLQRIADSTRFAGRVASIESERSGRAVLGAQRAHRGYQGVTMSGSSLEVLEETAANAAWNTSVIRYSYALEIDRIQYEKRFANYQARVSDFNASQAKSAAIIGAVGSLGSGFLSAGLRGL